jgi:hypothetical protein
MKKTKAMQLLELQIQLDSLNQLIDELKDEMWYNVHADAPHKAAKVKGWVDQLKEQAHVLHIQINQIDNQTTDIYE